MQTSKFGSRHEVCSMSVLEKPYIYELYLKKSKYIVLQVFLHRDNPRIWSKRFLFLRIRPSKPRISEYLKILPNIIYRRSILTNKTENKIFNFFDQTRGLTPFVKPNVVPCL